MRSSRPVKEFAFPGKRRQGRRQKLMKKWGDIQAVRKEAGEPGILPGSSLNNGRLTIC